MKLKEVKREKGRYDFEGVDVLSLTATEREFAAIVGISPAMVNRLKKMGAIKTDWQGRIQLIKSLREYRWYLPFHKRAAYDERIASSEFAPYFIEMSKIDA